MSVAGILGVKAKADPCKDGTKTKEVCDKEAAAAAAAKKVPAKFVPVKKDSGLECSMDGFVKMIKQVMENVLLLISLVKETIATILP